MLIWLIILFAVCVYKSKFSRFNQDYIAYKQSNANKGICAALILFSHLFQYITPMTLSDRLCNTILSVIGQLMVALFFFYSGYGIHQKALRDKEVTYFNTFFEKRIVKTLVKFDAALLLYILLNVSLSIHYPVSSYIWCWIGLGNIGNSSWFVFAILLLYAVTLLVFKKSKEKQSYKPIALITGITLLYCGVFRLSQSGTWWYDTILCFPFGMFFSLYQEKIEKIIKKKYYLAFLAMLFTLSALYFLKSKVTYWFFLPMAVVFCMLIIVINMKITVHNSVLIWLGNHSFSIFILQRIPMIILSEKNFTDNNMLFSLISVAATLLLAQIFDVIFDAVYKRITLAKTKTTIAH